MTTLKKQDLVGRGVSQLDHAASALISGDIEASQAHSDIAFAYARLAQSLGDSRVHIKDGNTRGNW